MLHAQELDRLESLRSYGVLDTGQDGDFDALTLLAALTCDAPVALVCLVDAERLWFKAAFGLDERELPRTSLGACPATVAQQAPLIVRDLQADERFRADPLVVQGRARSYAGVPLVGRDGLALGTLCVLDPRSRAFTLTHLSALRSLARQAVALLELRRLDQRMGNVPCGPRAHLSQAGTLRPALERAEFVPWFQPVVDLPSGSPVGFEALVRWQHPQEGTLSPVDFLPAVESTGLILPVGRAVLDGALDLLCALDASPAAPALLRVAVNVSAVQLSEPGLSDCVLAALDGRGVAPGRLVVELTESAALGNQVVARAELQRLHDAGVELSLDDYGTGHSSLQRALDLPLSTVKLDQGLVQQLPTDARARRAARGLVELFHDLGLRIVAEGIETPAQHEVALELGCDLGQGFLFSPALPADEVHVLLASAAASTPDH